MKCERKYSVYMHRNRFNDKKYFGITSKPINDRWQNGLGYKKNSHFYNSILKHGWDEGFDHVILAVGLDEECAKDIERLLIAVFNTQNSKFGYNVTAGGDACPMHIPDVKKKVSKSQKKNWRDPIYRENQRLCRNTPEFKTNLSEKLKKSWADGNSGFHNPICKQKLSVSLKKYYQTHPMANSERMKRYIKNHPEFKDKLRVASQNYWDNLSLEEKIAFGNMVKQRYVNHPEIKTKISDAVRMMWLNPLSAYNSIEYRNKLKESANNPMRIAKQKEKLSIHISNSNSNYNKSKPKRKKALQQAIGIKVVCLETGVVFNSLTDAAKSVGLSTASQISRCCKNKNFTAAGYHWKYASSLEDIEFRSNFGRNNGKKATKNRMKAVLCVETGVVYPSQKDAIVSLNLPPGCSISQCCRGKKATAGGYHWEYADKTLKHKYEKYSVQPRKKKILCVETGVVYDSVEEAMVSVGLKNAQCIFRCCRGKAGSAGGYHWEFADEISKNKYISYEYKQKYKKVLCVETKIIYNSLKEAGMVNGVRAGDISACCRGRQKTAGGYHWEYA